MLKRLWIVGLFLVIGCSKAETTLSDDEVDRIFVVMHDNDVPHIGFEGNLLVKETFVTYDEEQAGRFGFRLVAINVPPGEAFIVDGENDTQENEWITFTGHIVRTGDDGIAIDGTLINRTPVVLEFIEMTRGAAEAAVPAPEETYTPGEHAVAFRGLVTGWYRRLAGK